MSDKTEIQFFLCFSQYLLIKFWLIHSNLLFLQADFHVNEININE